MAEKTTVQRLADAGLVDTAALTPEDRHTIDQLTEAEVSVLIEVATRLYPEARGLVKLTDMDRRRVRICLPL